MHIHSLYLEIESGFSNNALLKMNETDISNSILGPPPFAILDQKKKALQAFGYQTPFTPLSIFYRG